MHDPFEGKTEIHIGPTGDESAQTIRRESPPSIGNEPIPVDNTSVDAGKTTTKTPPGSYPDRIGEYELMEELARGGMGVVFKARHSRLQRVVALKMILHGALAGDDNHQRFHLEATATAQLQHPSIVAIYEVDAHEGAPFFTMEFVEGVSLSQKLETGPLPGPLAARYLEQTARAVHFAHSRGILHRDLKPANVLLDEHDRPKVTDFGLAKVLQSDSRQTRSGAIMGTPSYMAPEQALARKNLSPACDTYSLGAILYELLTGRPPFQGETPMATMAMVIEQEAVPPRLLNPKVDADLETICLKCLEKEPSRRYLTAELLANDLQNYLEGRPISARRLSAVGRAVKWCRRKPASAALVAVSALALAGLVGGGLAFGMVQNSLREKAEREAEKAKTAERHALEAEDAARRQNKAFRYLLYVAQYRLARVAWESGDARRAQDWLKRWDHGAGDGPDPRGWEWYYLKGLCDGRNALRIPGGKATAVAFRADASWLATGDDGGGVQVWDVTTGKLLRTLKIHDYNVTALAFHPDGKRLAAAGEKAGNPGAVKVWDAATGDELFTVKGPTRAVHALAFSRDGAHLAAGDDDRTVTLWNGKTGAPVNSWRLLEGPVKTLAFDGDGQQLAAAAGPLVRVWNLKKEGEPVSLRHERPVFALAFTRGGELITLSGERSERGELSIRAWDAETATTRRTFPIPGQPWCILSSDGENVATCSADHQMAIWNASTGKMHFSSHWFMQPIRAFTFSGDGSRLACATEDGTVWMGYRLGGQEALGLPEYPGAARALVFHPDGTEIVCAGEAGARITDAITGVTKRSLEVMNNGKAFGVTAAAYSPDGTCLALASRDKTVRIFRTADAKQIGVLLGHTGPVWALAYSPDGKRIASGSGDRTVRLWDADTGSSLAVLEGHQGEIRALAYGRNDLVASADSSEDAIRVWDISSKTVKARLTGHENTIVTLAFGANGTRLASGSFDKTIRIWDIERMKEVSTLEGHTKVVNGVAFMPEGSRVVSGSGDGTVRIWDVVTRQELLKLDGGMREVSRVAVPARDDRRLACVGYDRIVRIWEADIPKKKPVDRE